MSTVVQFFSRESVFKGENLACDQKPAANLKTAILTTLAVSLLNPHVYLDTVVLLGSVASRFKEPGNFVFGAGAILASFTWFFSITYGARFLAPFLQKERAWKIIDTCIGLTMWGIAIVLLINL